MKQGSVRVDMCSRNPPWISVALPGPQRALSARAPVTAPGSRPSPPPARSSRILDEAPTIRPRHLDRHSRREASARAIALREAGGVGSLPAAALHAAGFAWQRSRRAASPGWRRCGRRWGACPAAHSRHNVADSSSATYGGPSPRAPESVALAGDCADRRLRRRSFPSRRSRVRGSSSASTRALHCDADDWASVARAGAFAHGPTSMHN